jgi:hypothetical protein
MLIAELQAEEADLLRTAEEARAASTAEHDTSTPDPAQLPGSVVERALVRQLKLRWRTTFRPAGDATAQLAQWTAFKTRVCQQEVSDIAMRPDQYECLLATLAPQTRPVPPAGNQPSRPAAPIRQAPRLVTPSPHQ